MRPPYNLSTDSQPFLVTAPNFQPRFARNLIQIRAGVSAKIFETETLTLRDRDETETLSKNSRRDRDLNVPRPRLDTRLLKPNVCNILQIFLTLKFGDLLNFPTHCNIDFYAFRYYIRNKLIKKVTLLKRYTFVFN